MANTTDESAESAPSAQDGVDDDADHRRDNAADLRAAGRLAIEATKGVTELVEAMHRTIASGPLILGTPFSGPARLITELVYGGIRGVTQVVGSGIDAALAQLAPLLGESAPGVEREAVLAALNGVLGDYLRDANNPLAIQMRLRRAGRPLTVDTAALRTAIPDAQGKLLVLVHGSSMNDLQWHSAEHDYGAALARDPGYSDVYLHYNSGLHISENGRAFSALLQQLVQAWPTPVEEIVLLGHSMGGLVSRSACHIAELEGHSWRQQLKHLVTLGTPHHGAPLERGGNWTDVLLGVSRYSAPLKRLAQIRSAGVTDLRFGNVLDEHWQGRDRFALETDRRGQLSLPAGVVCSAVAASTATDESERLPGDRLVPVDSALGRHPDPKLALPFAHTWVCLGTDHLSILRKPEVYTTVRGWLEGED